MVENIVLNVFFKSKTQLPRKERGSLGPKILRNCKSWGSIGITKSKITYRSKSLLEILDFTYKITMFYIFKKEDEELTVGLSHKILFKNDQVG